MARSIGSSARSSKRRTRPSSIDDPYRTAYSAKGIPVAVALERTDTLDVMGFGYAASVPLWYHMLNCGFRIPAAAGTDCFLNRITSSPPGWGRSYVHLPKGLDDKAWVEGQRTGHSFISNGPMLELSVGDAWVLQPRNQTNGATTPHCSSARRSSTRNTAG